MAILDLFPVLLRSAERTGPPDLSAADRPHWTRAYWPGPTGTITTQRAAL